MCLHQQELQRGIPPVLSAVHPSGEWECWLGARGGDPHGFSESRYILVGMDHRP